MSQIAGRSLESTDSDGNPPDWEAVREEIACPLCEYNLRGLIEPRCPECGYAFNWPELLEPERRLHPFLFEHHPERPVWSFIKTILGGLRPWRFWKSLHPAQPCRPRPLIGFAVWLLVPPVLIWVSLLGADIANHFSLNSQQRRWEKAWLSNLQNDPYLTSILKAHGSIEGYLNTYYPLTVSGILRELAPSSPVLLDYAVPSILLLAWPIVTLGALCVFEVSRRRICVGRIHIVRTVVYSADALWWTGLTAFVLAGSALTAGMGLRLSYPGNLDPVAVSYLLAAATIFVFFLRLVFAYRRYLRFPHAPWVVLSSQVIAGLVVMKLGLYLSMR